MEPLPIVADAAPLHIFAAGSLRPVFDRLVHTSPAAQTVTYANARDLAQRISAGEQADVFASASDEHPRLLHQAGLVHAPRPFATNRLVIAVPQDSAARDAEVLGAPGTRVVIEVAGIPLGDYTREMLARMESIAGPGFEQRALANVILEEQLVDAVAARLLTGEADAAVLYATDVAARAPQLRAIEIPPDAAIVATYVVCVTTQTRHPERAAAWLRGLVSPAARTMMRRAGFGFAPRYED